MAEYIEREALLKAASAWRMLVKDLYYCGYDDCITAMEDTISDAPAADVEPVTHAEWEYDGADRRCSNCGAIVEEDEWFNHNWYYCYHCGARMGGEENAE